MKIRNINLEMVTPDFRYSLNLENKVTIIHPYKGSTGKTLIGDIISIINEMEGKDPNFYINKKVEFFSDVLDINSLKTIDRDIIVIDESCRELNTRRKLIDIVEFRNVIYTIPAIVIIITRSVSSLVFSVNQVYDLYLDKSDNTRKLKPRFDLLNVNHKIYKEILTEDSKSGFDYFNDNGIRVSSYFGASKILDKINCNEHKYKLVMFDMATYHSSFERLYEEATTIPKGETHPICDLCVRQSFEQQLLFSSFILESKYKDMILSPDPKLVYHNVKTPSLEKYYERTYKKVLRDTYGGYTEEADNLHNIDYDKSTTPICHYKLCSTCKNKKCTLRDNSIKNKFLDFLKQNDLEYLVKDEKQIKDNSSLNSIGF